MSYHPILPRYAFSLIAVLLPLLGGQCLGAPRDRYAAHIANTKPRTPADEKKSFQLPPGFEIQLVAAEPDISKPLNLAFDERGRLWVSDTLEYPYPAGAGKKPRDTVKVLDQFGPDGRAHKITTFASGLNIPIGVIPLIRTSKGGREALVFNVPRIDRLRDTTDDGKADRRDPFLGTYGHRDTHGLTSAFTWGFDGRIYACHGFANTSTVKGKDGSQIRMNSGNVYRFLPDGTQVQQYTHGQVNPFGLAFDPLGNIYTADCHSQPIYQILRGAYYPSFGKPHDGLGFGPRMIHRYKGSTAIAGVVYYAADQFPPSYRDTAFVGDVVTNQLVQFQLDWKGSTPLARQQVFLKSNDPWFRPVDIQLGPDGALYVADFYNRIIGHYEVPLNHPGRDRHRGRIWRIVYRGSRKTPATPPPAYQNAFRKASRQENEANPTQGDLIQALGHPNLMVRMHAANWLVARGKDALPANLDDAMKKGHRQRIHGLWVRERLDLLGPEVLRTAVDDTHRGVRVHALRILSERPALASGLRTRVQGKLKDRDAHVQRSAADVLGQHPSAENIRPLLDLRHRVSPADTHLLYVVRQALRNQLQARGTWNKLPTIVGTEKDRSALVDVALAVPGSESAAFLLMQVKALRLGGPLLQRCVHHIFRHGTARTRGGWLALFTEKGRYDTDEQLQLLRAMQRGAQERGADLDRQARDSALALTEALLKAKKPERVRAGIEMVGLLKWKEKQDLLSRLVLLRSTPTDQRRTALDALLALDDRACVPVLVKVLNDPTAPIEVREHVASLLARLNRPKTRTAMGKALQVAPARLQRTIARLLANSREGGELLLDAVTRGKASARVLTQREVAGALQRARIANLKQRLVKLTRGLPAPDARLRTLLARHRQGYLKANPDVQRGLKAFTKHCAACHQVGDTGARVGPQLNGIGLRGLDRLLEDILDPNRNVDQAFRTTFLDLKNGRQHKGLLLKEEGELLVLVDSEGKQQRIPRKQVERRFHSALSPMPANLGEVIPEKTFYDLLCFLLSQR